jgi:hypothetical protein
VKNNSEVKAMRLCASISLAVVLSLVSVHAVIAAPIPGLANTGQGLAPGQADPNYTGYAVVPYGVYVTPPAGSSWISHAITGTNQAATVPAGVYTYSSNFDLTGFDPSTAALSFQVASDNNLEIRLNGNTVYTLTAANNLDQSTFNQLYNVNLSSGFVAGINNLLFLVTNLPVPNANDLNPEALLVANIQGSADLAVVPEPISLVVWSALGGLGAICVCRRRRRSSN